MENGAASSPEKKEIDVFEWNLEYLSANYVGKRVQIPYWCISENNTFEPYVKQALCLVEEVSATEDGQDGEITFDLIHVDFDAYSPNQFPLMSTVTRIGPPEDIIIKNSREIWVYGDKSGEDDLTLEFVVYDRNT